MTHDPLCPFAEWPEESCYQPDAGVSVCVLIARVREDEAAKRRADLIWQDGYDIALRDAIIAANNQRSKFKARDWDDAIDAVVAAIQAIGGER